MVQFLLRTYIDVDIRKISQVFRKLLSNALKYTLKCKKVEIKADCINTSIKQQNGHMSGVKPFLRIQVIDEGAGISKV